MRESTTMLIVFFLLMSLTIGSNICHTTIVDSNFSEDPLFGEIDRRKSACMTFYCA